MTATLTLTDRPGTVALTNEPLVRAIAAAVATFNRGDGDELFRVALPGRSRRSVSFRASQVKSLNADGIDLVDLGNPFAQVKVAA